MLFSHMVLRNAGRVSHDLCQNQLGGTSRNNEWYWMTLVNTGAYSENAVKPMATFVSVVGSSSVETIAIITTTATVKLIMSSK